ncbi:MAG TPA: Ni-sirohydrochlorin a,c-diamide reductive cyclase catalytic subunit [Methanothermobacter sp.]|nr:nitrogenase molybdenum-iron protein [Methanothermobacter sp. MT-2]HHW05231.1 Ni-sirohydrochlorin a,c-diamide reductive cyclase catalytic subunit [Methanothermobacter sp.]HOK73424.1 Ni-sirohydrochlorin a,c-diamide reductive cyclase catalytic subunit [Methanothermobacter sp.]HOL69704.1 Ni-sirohydrochlorin a,c-diamide reductive cyclase catalytic subunit [Methanothermobacter sp.]HPQ05274.1 Ni-sirohydrochlorin a,c-diamide reductive cyclase catalytic subunit [Methanothermobacter sp.]
MHPRPSPIAAALYTLRDLDVDVIVLHGPTGCCFRTARLLENDGVRVLTTAMSENDFIFGAHEKLEKTLKKAEEMFSPKLIGVVGTCASMIIGEDLREAVQKANISAKVLTIESHGGFGEGDNTEGAIIVLEEAANSGLITWEEAERQIEMLKRATEIEKTRGMARGEYIKPSYGDDKDEVAREFLKSLRDGERVAIVLNAKKETAYLFADILKISYPDNIPIVIANLRDDIGLPRIRRHAQNIRSELESQEVKIDYLTGGLDEYPITGEIAGEILEKEDVDFALVAGVPHAVPIENLDIEAVAITDGPRLVKPLKELGYDYVVAELDAHAKTLGVEDIVQSDFGESIRKNIKVILDG